MPGAGEASKAAESSTGEHLEQQRTTGRAVTERTEADRPVAIHVAVIDACAERDLRSRVKMSETVALRKAHHTPLISTACGLTLGGLNG